MLPSIQRLNIKQRKQPTQGGLVSREPSPIVDRESGVGYTQTAPLGNAEPFLQAPNEIFYPDNQGVQDYWQQ